MSGPALPVLGLVGIPTSAGSHHAGQERAPRRLREAGLPERLRAAGRMVVDHGDAPVMPYRPMGIGVASRDADRVVAVVRDVAERVGRVVDAGQVPLVLGGDCTVTLGVVSALLRRSPGLGLLYFDGDADLGTPGPGGSGVLDSMGVTHLLGGGDPRLARVGPRHPLLGDDRIALVGYHPVELAPADARWLAASRILTLPVTAMGDDPVVPAARVMRSLARAADGVLVHFDVDVIDSGDAPLANFPHFNGGLSLAAAGACLRVFTTAPEFRGLVVTELNPDHDVDGSLLPDFVARLAGALAG